MVLVSFEIDLSAYAWAAAFSAEDLAGVAKRLLLADLASTQQRAFDSDRALSAVKDEMRQHLQEPVRELSRLTREKLEPVVDTLFGLAKTSSSKGAFTQSTFLEMFRSNLPEYAISDTAKTAHMGDAHVVCPSGQTVIVEYKNYSNAVGKAEVDKLKHDMTASGIRFGLFLSVNSAVCHRRTLDVESFVRGEATHWIVFVSHVGVDFGRVAYGVYLLEALFRLERLAGPLARRDEVAACVDRLRCVGASMVGLRDKYVAMDAGIREQLNEFHRVLLEHDVKFRAAIDEALADVYVGRAGGEAFDVGAMPKEHARHRTTMLKLADLAAKHGYALELDADGAVQVVGEGRAVARCKYQKETVEVAWAQPRATFKIAPADAGLFGALDALMASAS